MKGKNHSREKVKKLEVRENTVSTERSVANSRNIFDEEQKEGGRWICIAGPGGNTVD